MCRSIKEVFLGHWSDNKTACSTVDDPRIELAFAISCKEFSVKTVSIYNFLSTSQIYGLFGLCTVRNEKSITAIIS